MRQEAQKAFADVTKMQQRLDKMNQELAERTDYESESYLALIEKYTTEHDRFMMMGAENCEAELERTLAGLVHSMVRAVPGPECLGCGARESRPCFHQ